MYIHVCACVVLTVSMVTVPVDLENVLCNYNYNSVHYGEYQRST